MGNRLVLLKHITVCTRDCGVSLERVTHTRAVQYGIPWVTGGKVYSIGRGCNGVSYAFLQCGYTRGFTSVRGCMQGSFCRFWKISLGFCNHASLLTWGNKGINGVWCATWLVRGPSSPLRGSMAGLHRLS